MLEMLTFDLMVDTPYQRLYDCLTQLDLLHNKNIRGAAWAYCCDSALTVLPLLMNAREVAISAVFFATVSLGEKIEDDQNGEPWWRVLKGDESLTQSAISVVMDFYSENPMRKSDSRYQGSPVFSLENTRRGRDFPSQTEAESSQNGTPSRPERDDEDSGVADVKKESIENGDDEPMDVDTSTQFKGDSDVVLKNAANDLDYHEGKPNGAPAINGLRSPPAVKRKSPDGESDGEDREQKRARLSDEDEGEVRET